MAKVGPAGFGKRLALFALFISLVAGAAPAAVPPQEGSAIEALVFEHRGLYIDETPVAPDALAGLQARSARGALSRLGIADGHAYYDRRSGRPATLLLSRPMVPGTGVGNNLASTARLKGEAAMLTDEEIGQAAWQAFRAFLVENQEELGIDPDQLAGDPQISVLEEGRLIQIVVGRTVGGLSVRGSMVNGVINHGNLVLYGTSRWGDVDIAPPTLSLDEARAAIAAYVAGAPHQHSISEPMLEILPFSESGEERGANSVVGARSESSSSTTYNHRLAWVARVDFDEDHGDWEVMLDAHTAEILAFADQNQYLARQIRGGVYPLSNDQAVPDGVEYPGWPMPFANANTARTTFSNSNGLLPSTFASTIQTTLDGQYVRILDNCGSINQSAANPNDLDLGASGGTDCTRPPGTGTTGTTHAARTGFYELNRLKEQWRSWLPTNNWLNARLTSNMNINNTCNAFWSGSGTSGTVNFYRFGGGCANTGEIAGVFDHEAGHGFDANNGITSISNPGEYYADMVAILRLNRSCLGRGFRINDVQCSGNGDPCLECTGVRQEDYAKRLSGLPHNINWIRQNFQDPGQQDASGNWIRWPGGCTGDGRTGGPCNQGVHCEGSVLAEAFWDLLHRDLAGQFGSPFNWEENRRLNFMARMGIVGLNSLGTAFSCATNGFGGCGSSSAYMLLLAADDDNGNIADGTPHMTAIFNSHNRHQMACGTPMVQNSGCASRPTTAPTITATTRNNAATISWTTVPGATKYWLFKGDGVDGCLAGKQRLVNTNVTSFVDTSLVNGREFFYTVMAVGNSDTCSGPASDCLSLIPAPAAPVASPQSVSTDEDTAVLVTLAATDEDSPSLTFSIASGPGAGTLGAVSAASCIAQGAGSSCTATVTYTPNPDYNGADAFTYRASDGGLSSADAIASITVTPVNDAPVANDASATGEWNTTLAISLSASDIDSASLAYAVVAGPTHGTVVIGAPSCSAAGEGSTCTAVASYTPTPGYTGPDSFTYRVNDGELDSNVASVTILVTRGGKITGSGTIVVAGTGAAAEFEMSVDRNSSRMRGDLTYRNLARGLTVRSVAITSVNIWGVTGTFEGTCTKNGAPCTFTVTVEDNGEPPTGDRFTIAVSGEPVEGDSGSISSGNIQVHKP